MQSDPNLEEILQLKAQKASERSLDGPICDGGERPAVRPTLRGRFGVGDCLVGDELETSPALGQHEHLLNRQTSLPTAGLRLERESCFHHLQKTIELKFLHS